LTDLKVFGLPEEPLKNAAVKRMSVSENMAFRSFDKPPMASIGWWLKPLPMRDNAVRLIDKYHGQDTLGGRRRSRTSPAAMCKGRSSPGNCPARSTS
jgi:ABC-type uncharacterized transport system ATPase subunit